MKKKYIIIGVVVICLALLMPFGYRLFMFFRYYNKYSYDESLNIDFKISKTIYINSDTDIDYEYFEIDGIKIRNDFNDFTYEEDNYNKYFHEYSTYVLNDSTELIEFSKQNTFVDAFKHYDASYYFLEITEDLSNEKINKDMVSYLEENNIVTDIDLINFVLNNKPELNTIFTDIEKMKENYLFSKISASMSTWINVDLIEGDYTGYIFDTDFNSKYINILKNNKKYVIVVKLDSDYFTDDYINELLNTVVIE